MIELNSLAARGNGSKNLTNEINFDFYHSKKIVRSFRE